MRAAGSGTEAGPELGLGAGSEAESGAGAGSVEEAGLRVAARTRELAEPEAGVPAKDRSDARAGAEAGPEARVLAAPLGLVPRPAPGLRCPWRLSGFLQ